MNIEKRSSDPNYGYELSFQCEEDKISFTYSDFSSIEKAVMLAHRTHLLKRLFMMHSGINTLKNFPIKMKSLERSLISTKPDKQFIEWVDDMLSYCITPISTLDNSTIVRFLAKHIGKEVKLKETCWIPV